MAAEAFYSQEGRCWYIPVALETLREELRPGMVLEPVRIELKDNQLWITQLPSEDG